MSSASASSHSLAAPPVPVEKDWNAEYDIASAEVMKLERELVSARTRLNFVMKQIRRQEHISLWRRYNVKVEPSELGSDDTNADAAVPLGVKVDGSETTRLDLHPTDKKRLSNGECRKCAVEARNGRCPVGHAYAPHCKKAKGTAGRKPKPVGHADLLCRKEVSVEPVKDSVAALLGSVAAPMSEPSTTTVRSRSQNATVSEALQSGDVVERV